MNFFARRVIPVEDAAGLLAETFLATWRHLARLPTPEEERRMWMYGIARNVLRNWNRGIGDVMPSAISSATNFAPPDMTELRSNQPSRPTAMCTRH